MPFRPAPRLRLTKVAMRDSNANHNPAHEHDGVSWRLPKVVSRSHPRSGKREEDESREAYGPDLEVQVGTKQTVGEFRHDGEMKLPRPHASLQRARHGRTSLSAVERE